MPHKARIINRSEGLLLNRQTSSSFHSVGLGAATTGAHGAGIVGRVLGTKLIGGLGFDFFLSGVGTEDAAGGEGDALHGEVEVFVVGAGKGFVGVDAGFEMLVDWGGGLGVGGHWSVGCGRREVGGVGLEGFSGGD